MKKFRLLSAVMVLFAALGMASCETEPLDSDLLEIQNPGGDGNSNAPASFKVDFSGQTYNATIQNANVQGNTITVSGFRGMSGESVAMIIPGTTTGTYSGASLVYLPNTSGNFYSSLNPNTLENNGTVTITNINTTNHTISGTFNFTGHWTDTDANLPTIAFTNGTFTNVPYTGTIPGTGPGPNPQEEYYRATIDGVAQDYSDDISVISSGGFINLMGEDAENTISITVNGEDTPGAYELTSNPFPGPTAFYSNSEGIFTSTVGTLTIISKQDGYIKGTFTFLAGTSPDSFNVTNGEFNIQYE